MDEAGCIDTDALQTKNGSLSSDPFLLEQNLN